jgi:hypothetical protein
MRKILVLLLVLASGSLLQAEPYIDSNLVLTVYDGLALVTKQQTLELKPGINHLTVKVPSRVIPSSCLLWGDGGFSLLEQHYIYEPLTTRQLLQKHLGLEIEVREREASYRGVLVSIADGEVILEDRFGEVHVIKEPTGFTFPSLPQLAEPKLKWLIESELSGQVKVWLSCLTEGMNWSAEYTAILHKKMYLSGWVSVVNNSGMTYENANLRLVAGRLHRYREREKEKGIKAPLALRAEEFIKEEAFEYHLYTLKRPVTLEDGKVVQLAFIDSLIDTEKQYIYEGQRIEGVGVRIEFTTEEPLPAGIVRLYEEREGEMLFIGEDMIPHTPLNEEVSLFAGIAFDVVGERIRTEHAKLDGRYRDSFLITLRNHKDEEVIVTVVEHLGGDWRIIHAEPDFTVVDADTIQFKVPVAAGGEATIRYTVEYRF